MRCNTCGSKLITPWACPQCGGGDGTQTHHAKAASIAPEVPVANEKILKFFQYKHLPTVSQFAAQPFHQLAEWCHTNLPPGAERSVALRKLLEAREAAIRAVQHPGG